MIVLVVIIGLFGLDLFLAKFGFFKVAPWSVYIGQHEFIEKISKNTVPDRYLLTPKTDEDFCNWPLDRMSLSASYAPLFGIYSIQGMEVMRVNHYEHFIDLMKKIPTLEAAKRLFDISGVRYIITSYKMDDKNFRLLKEIPVYEKNAYLYEYLQYPGRFLMFNRAVYVEDTKAAMEKLNDNAIDLRTTLIIIDKDRKQSDDDGRTPGAATLVSYDANKVIIECEAKTDVFLYVSDTWYPGWKAYIDGKQTKIYRANVAFRAVEIPAGKHRVAFRYVPLSFYCGLVLTCIGIFLCWYLIKRDNKARLLQSTAAQHSTLQSS